MGLPGRLSRPPKSSTPKWFNLGSTHFSIQLYVVLYPHLPPPLSSSSHSSSVSSLTHSLNHSFLPPLRPCFLLPLPFTAPLLFHLLPSIHPSFRPSLSLFRPFPSSSFFAPHFYCSSSGVVIVVFVATLIALCSCASFTVNSVQGLVLR